MNANTARPSSRELAESAVTGGFVQRFGGRYYRIAHCDRLAPFFMNIVSPSDLWLFLASNGAMTSGRIDANHALFPYQTVDKIYDSAGKTGPFTAIWAESNGEHVLWEPFAPHTDRLHPVTRNIFKSVEGDRVWFEEIHNELGVAFRYGWSTAEAYGFIRQCELENLTDGPLAVRVLDGLRNLMSPGIPLSLQRESSCLADAYKTAELQAGTSLAVYALAAGIVDRPIPMEALRANIVWSEGLPEADVLLSDAQLNGIFSGDAPVSEIRRRGVRANYLLSADLTLHPQRVRAWLMVADTHLSQAEVASRRQQLAAGGMGEAARKAADVSTQRLRALVGSADGLQSGGDETTTVHHFANVLFNIMRGGVFVSGEDLPGHDFAAFVHIRNRLVAQRQAAFLDELPVTLSRSAFMDRVRARADTDLDRLAYEYLPLTFSRRHGDPSRPWNRFSIRVRDEHGNRVLNHEGNWRDIFQNWEALCLSFPGFLENIVAKFVNASTIDGYNPYRITHAGIEWEVPSPEDPWASIGYWGDHQVVYLLKLLEWSGRFHPGRIEHWLRRDMFSYANVPYRIADYADTRRNPRATIEFDAMKNEAIERLVKEMGTDGRFIQGPGGGVLHVNFTEKLLVLVLARLVNFIPGGGIWMNTQRPEWNDANNALVGYGVSMVTLCYLRRLLVRCRTGLLPALGADPVQVSGAVAALSQQVLAALEAHRGLLAQPVISDSGRRRLADALAQAGSSYRAGVYRGGPGARVAVAPQEILGLFDLALAFVDHSIRTNRRSDGLYHSYNLLEFSDEPTAIKVRPLPPMLEGQVAVLSAGLLTPAEAVDLMVSLRNSPLHRADQHSYLLYPDRELPGFLERNIIPSEALSKCPFLGELIAEGDTRLIQRDDAGSVRFHADLVNGDALDARLQVLAEDPRWAGRAASDSFQVKAIYERVFNHRAFTGRSGSMFGYEGLGCIYWHMVAKLLVAVQENLLIANAGHDSHAGRLAEIYYDVRSGLGFNKTPMAFGAFPTDPYSHTPGHSGAQQPGMTGQVKEEILTRLGELGVTIEQGSLGFFPTFLREAEFAREPQPFRYVRGTGQEYSFELPADSLGFTFCGVPVIYTRTPDDAARICVRSRTGFEIETAGSRLSVPASAEIFSRLSHVERIHVHLGSDFKALQLPSENPDV